jgi:hypothetical protein
MKCKATMEPTPVKKESSNPAISEIVDVVNHYKHVEHPIKTSLLAKKLGISIDVMLVLLLRLFPRLRYTNEKDDALEYSSF